MEYPEVNEKNIWNFRQNNPELIIQDARKYLGLDNKDCEMLRVILLARGVNKWLKVRRDLIAYKKQIKHALKKNEADRLLVKSHLKASHDPRLHHSHIALKATTKILMEIRHQLKDLCNTDRWQLWPQLGSHHKELREMNTLTARD